LGTGITHHIPFAAEVKDGEASYKKSLAYMGFHEDEQLIGKPVDYVFLGSCTMAVLKTSGLLHQL